MSLNRGQALELSVGYAVASRTATFVEALLDLYEKRAPGCEDATEAAREAIRRYQALADRLADDLQLGADPHDLRPILIDQVYRMRDALHPTLVGELENFGALDPDLEPLLRQRLATLSLLTGEIARQLQRLPRFEV